MSKVTRLDETMRIRAVREATLGSVTEIDDDYSKSCEKMPTVDDCDKTHLFS